MNQMPNRKRDKRQLNAAVGMCVGLAVGALGLVVCTRLGYTDYATIPVVVCMVIGGIAGMLVKNRK